MNHHVQLPRPEVFHQELIHVFKRLRGKNTRMVIAGKQIPTNRIGVAKTIKDITLIFFSFFCTSVKMLYPRSLSNTLFTFPIPLYISPRLWLPVWNQYAL